ncbi:MULTISPECIES: acetate kinase [unclassified Oceanispirochaeta]|uniref:acetate kinase n=1 Tax=unclassified Oceanispirochaeta TaxID=2635722 RepID=UPI000E09D06A|nr:MULTISPECIES: acetate kinase [unclassified Oceanispirochaeta]MBF9014738.1 acetate kinase [Oceanispirochaeta sp. M2]NPD70994.1 acetate kinase [Oceanispirochaeta sp. M1]RDG33827.1 acetate kinase [Oceanispirochaeta sp. M1]
MVILTLNCGSSSAKFQVYDWEKKEVLGVGMVERIGESLSNIEHSPLGKPEFEEKKACPTHKEAVEWIISTILDKDAGCISDMSEIKAVGHRVVHGGEAFKKSVIVDESVLKAFEELNHLAPLHNPANILGIRGAMLALPNVPHCAIMDTAWHQTMPSLSFMYALPYDWYEKNNVRRYGFHGTSYLYTAKRAAVLMGKKASETNVIIAHIGNGASMCAVKDGKGYDTSMGMTPLEGLMMGTRSGDIDPAIVTYMMNEKGMDTKEMDATLNKKSGVLGITKEFVDRRDVQAGVDKGDIICTLAQDMEAYRIKKYIGSYYAAIGRVDAIVFTAGVGEMNPSYRAKSLMGLENMGIIIDEKKNLASISRNCETCISADNSPVKVFVIPTDEELVMTEDTFALMNGSYDVHENYTYYFQSKEYKNKARERALPGNIKKNPALKDVIVEA